MEKKSSFIVETVENSWSKWEASIFHVHICSFQNKWILLLFKLFSWSDWVLLSCISQFQLCPRIWMHGQSQGWGISLPQGYTPTPLPPGLLRHAWFLALNTSMEDFIGKDQKSVIDWHWTTLWRFLGYISSILWIPSLLTKPQLQVSLSIHWSMIDKDQCECVDLPESIHTQPVEGHWKFLAGGGS